MPRLILVRHGRAAAGWGDDLDPGLDELGRAQAGNVAKTLADQGPLAIVTSPLRRCQETAAPLAAAWQATATVDPRVGEIESPSPNLADRAAWLGPVMRSEWSAQPPELHTWRQRVIDGLLSLTGETVVFTHFVAINVAFGAATGDDRVTCFAPDNCSVTTFESDGTRLTVVDTGRQAETRVL
jgi:broad specificity phosphatase PhoE